MSRPIIDDTKLSRSFYMALDEGVYLVSGVGGFTPLDPRCFEGYVASVSKRAVQWGLIKEARADQRSCSVFASKEAFQEWKKGWKPREDGEGWCREDPV